ncbi:13984_t:CDS:2 [Gigaspora margarita]|uniref:13984_t:CDS:1 n=1 Tax=Gigaspora margarita TaxID=4874 RepID=A0ABN7V2Y0_GIGMA|nr:13984_t:CDS:2 [Gigaspora margarita]
MHSKSHTDLRAYLGSLQELETQNKIDWYWSDFTILKSTDEATYKDCVRFWRKVLVETSNRGLLGEDVICLETKETLEDNFQNKGYSPLSLPCVIQEMYMNNEIMPANEFISTQNQSWTSWIVSKFIVNPIYWRLQKLISSGNYYSAKWVKMDTLKEAAIRVLQYQEKHGINGITDNLYTLSSFKAEFATVAMPNVTLSDFDIKILIIYLESERKVLITGSLHEDDNNKDMIIKFKAKNLNANTKFEITSIDRGIIYIRETCDKLHQQIHDIEERIKEISTKIHNYILRKQNVMAKHCLRQKMHLEKVLSKRVGSLETVERILLKIQGAASDAEIIDIYNVGANTLHDFMASTGLTADSVDATIDKLQDILADQQEIDEAMKLGTDSLLDAASIQDEELENELESLIANETVIKESPAIKPTKPSIPQQVHNNEDTIKVSDTTKVSDINKVNDDEELEQLEAMLADLSVPTNVPKDKTQNKKEVQENIIIN